MSTHKEGGTMKKFFGKKRTLALAVVAVLAVAAAAFAYWTTSGSGTGTAAVSSGGANLTVTDTSTLTAMYPGDSAQTLQGTVKNNADNKATVDSVTASIASVDHPNGACDATDFTLSNATMTVGQELAKDAVANFSGATIQFNNKNTNQDGCKGATVHLTYTVNSN
jgi:hypothetical protein